MNNEIEIVNSGDDVVEIDIAKMARQVDELHTLVTKLMAGFGAAVNAPGMQGAMVRQMLPPNLVNMFGV